MIEAPDPRPSLDYTYEYDAENRLVKVTQSATVLGEYTYDGNLKTKKAPRPNDTELSTETITTEYAYDALQRRRSAA